MLVKLLYDKSVDDDFIVTKTSASLSFILLSIAVNTTDCSMLQFDSVNTNDDFEIESLELVSFELIFNITFDVGCDFNLNVLVIDWPSVMVVGVVSVIMPDVSLSLIVIANPLDRLL